MRGGLREGRPCGLWPLFLLDLYQDPRCCHLEGSCGLQKSAQDPRFCHLESSCGVQNAAPANIKYCTRQSVSDCQVKVLDICWAFGVKIHPRNYQIYEPGTQRAPKVAVKTCIQLLCVFFIHAPSPTKCDETQFESFISRPL